MGGRDWSWSPLSSHHITPLFTFISPLSLPSSLLPPSTHNFLQTSKFLKEFCHLIEIALDELISNSNLHNIRIWMRNQIWFLFLWLLIVLVKGSINFLCFCILFLSVRDLKIQKIDISVVTMYRLILVQCRLVIRIVDMSSLIFICHEAKIILYIIYI